MRYRALATDGDGTLLENNRIAPATARALEKLRAASILLILVTRGAYGDGVVELAEQS